MYLPSLPRFQSHFGGGEILLLRFFDLVSQKDHPQKKCNKKRSERSAQASANGARGRFEEQRRDPHSPARLARARVQLATVWQSGSGGSPW